MDKAMLEEFLAQGMSLDVIGERVGRHPSTVSYWLKKHGLTAVGAATHAPKGQVDPARLRELVGAGASIREIAEETGAGYSTIRHWLGRLGLETVRSTRRKECDSARRAGLKRVYLRCGKHGHTAFFERPDGGFRCAQCNTEAVSERRRQVKRMLVKEAGGRCARCGFAEHQAALQFHHLDPSSKAFHLGHQGQTRSLARMRAEARKCILLCANCHALVEAGVAKVPIDVGKVMAR